MKSFYFMSAVFIMAVSLAIRAEEVKSNATVVKDRYRVTNSSTRDCRGHVFGGMMIEQKLPGLFYADDIVLFADSRDDIQQLANIFGREGEALGLGFSVTKCGLMVFNDPCDQTVSIQGQEIPRCGEYGKEDCKSGCLCYTGNATEPFLCISSMEADFYKTASRYS
uniref:Putative tick transposon n=1 Tax=Rhipicephalus microplus TaxID=6941 RepID=A0A6M2DBX8_RHIMP